MKWEYTFRLLEFSNEIAASETITSLNQEGLLGWEVIAFEPIAERRDRCFLALLKRVKPD